MSWFKKFRRKSSKKNQEQMQADMKKAMDAKQEATRPHFGSQSLQPVGENKMNSSSHNSSFSNTPQMNPSPSLPSQNSSFQRPVSPQQPPTQQPQQPQPPIQQQPKPDPIPVAQPKPEPIPPRQQQPQPVPKREPEPEPPKPQPPIQKPVTPVVEAKIEEPPKPATPEPVKPRTPTPEPVKPRTPTPEPVAEPVKPRTPTPEPVKPRTPTPEPPPREKTPTPPPKEKTPTPPPKQPSPEPQIESKVEPTPEEEEDSMDMDVDALLDNIEADNDDPHVCYPTQSTQIEEFGKILKTTSEKEAIFNFASVTPLKAPQSFTIRVDSLPEDFRSFGFGLVPSTFRNEKSSVLDLLWENKWIHPHRVCWFCNGEFSAGFFL